jgi:hypothetical protein
MAASLKGKRTPITTPPYQVPSVNITPDPPIFSLVTTFKRVLYDIVRVSTALRSKGFGWCRYCPGTLHAEKVLVSVLCCVCTVHVLLPAEKVLTPRGKGFVLCRYLPETLPAEKVLTPEVGVLYCVGTAQGLYLRRRYCPQRYGFCTVYVLPRDFTCVEGTEPRGKDFVLCMYCPGTLPA